MTNEITNTALNESDFIPNGWCSINYPLGLDINNPEICFKLKVWEAQCIFANKVSNYLTQLSFGNFDECLHNNLLNLKYALELLNSIDVMDLENTKIDYNYLFKIFK